MRRDVINDFHGLIDLFLGNDKRRQEADDIIARLDREQFLRHQSFHNIAIGGNAAQALNKPDPTPFGK